MDPSGQFFGSKDREALDERRFASGDGPGVFVSTQWSVVIRAGMSDTEDSMLALERLCRTYWRPLYHYVRRRGYKPEDAQDLTQGFFARLLEKDLIVAADRGRGRFRSFLLKALENYVTNEWHKAGRQMRGGGAGFISLDELSGAETAYGLGSVQEETPEIVYERKWAQALLTSVLERLRTEFDERGGTGRFDVLKGYLFEERGEVPYAESAARLGMSEPALKSAIYRMRQRYGELFAEEIAGTVSDSSEVDAEIQHLLGLFGRRGG